jgi:aspartate aminotransferase
MVGRMNFYELAERALQLEKEGHKMIRLNIGDTGLPTPSCVIEAASRNMHEKKAKYVSSAGIPELREAIAAKEGCSVENVVVGPGSKALLYGLFTVLAQKGEKIVFPSPYWPAYPMTCKQLGLLQVNVKGKVEENWEFGELPLEGAKVFLLCNPLNPTSSVYSPKLIERCIKECAESGVQMILDEAYRDLAFSEIPRYDGEIVRVRSFSKEFNMEGWRIGYMVAPAEIAKKMVSYNQITATCVPEFIQWGAIAALENEKEIVSSNKEIWKTRAGIAGKALTDAGFEFAEPGSGIYAFATHPKITDAWDFALKMLDRGVAVAPGSPFGGYDSFVRICLSQPAELLEEAIGKMGEALK